MLAQAGFRQMHDLRTGLGVLDLRNPYIFGADTGLSECGARGVGCRFHARLDGKGRAKRSESTELAGPLRATARSQTGCVVIVLALARDASTTAAAPAPGAQNMN